MMFMMSSKISVFDYIVFGVSLVVPVAIALFYSCVKKQIRKVLKKPIPTFLLGIPHWNLLTLTFFVIDNE